MFFHFHHMMAQLADLFFIHLPAYLMREEDCVHAQNRALVAIPCIEKQLNLKDDIIGFFYGLVIFYMHWSPYAEFSLCTC